MTWCAGAIPPVYREKLQSTFLNKIQKVAYTLNPFVVDVAETLMAKGRQVGKFIPVVDIPLPPKPVDIAENYDSRKDYRRRAAEVMNINAQAFQKSCRTRMTMNAVKVFKNKKVSSTYLGRLIIDQGSTQYLHF